MDWTHFDQATGWTSRAFADDPFTLYIFSNKAAPKQHDWYNSRIVMAGLKYGRSFVTKDLTGSAIWMEPGKWKFSYFEMVLCGLPLFPFKLGWGAFSKFMNWMEIAETKHKKYMREDHWYLLSLAVDPPHQGKGLGSALIRHGTMMADEKNLPCYLESSSQRSRDLYLRHGFKVMEELSAGPGGPPMCLMHREKRTET
jgi:ribosomal protein S18 acetylase RimI-like enzyme